MYKLPSRNKIVVVIIISTKDQIREHSKNKERSKDKRKDNKYVPNCATFDCTCARYSTYSIEINIRKKYLWGNVALSHGCPRIRDSFSFYLPGSPISS